MATKVTITVNVITESLTMATGNSFSVAYSASFSRQIFPRRPSIPCLDSSFTAPRFMLQYTIFKSEKIESAPDTESKEKSSHSFFSLAPHFPNAFTFWGFFSVSYSLAKLFPSLSVIIYAFNVWRKISHFIDAKRANELRLNANAAFNEQSAALGATASDTSFFSVFPNPKMKSTSL